MSAGEEVELVGSQPPACVPQELDMRHHTRIQHGDHQGWLVNGKLLCKTGDSDVLVECCLDWEAEVGCQIVQMLDGHVHSPTCGHEQVPHGDHVDYLVDGRLHHVVSQPSCCKHECLGFLSEASVVDHGGVSVLKHRSPHPVHSEKDETHHTEEEIVTSIFAARICCPSEVPIINKILGHINGVKNIDVAVMTKTVKVTHFPSVVSPAILVSALNDAGLQASLGARGQGSGGSPKHPPWTVLGSGFLLLLSLLSLFGEDFAEFKYVAISATVIGSPFIVMRAWAALMRFILDINVLMIIAIAGAIGLGEYYESAAIVFLFGLAEWLENRCMGRARTAVRVLSELQPEFAVDAVTGTTIPVGEVKVDHVIIIRPGDRVPVDCVVVSGDSAVDESLLTGETRPVPKQSGSELKSGTINSGKGSLKARATATVQSSTIAQVALLVDEASMQKSTTEKFIEKFAKVYTPAVVIGAVALAIIPPAMGRDPKAWIYLSLLLLVTACPCALVISTPVVTVCGITRAAKKSILIKGGQYLEELARVKAITFDKTGTLTEGRFGVTSIVCSENFTKEEVLTLAAALEVHSTHPLGPAIAGYALARNCSKWGDVTEMKLIQGKGITGIINRKKIGCGNAALMKTLCPGSPLPKVSVNGFSIVSYISQDDMVIGAIVVTDSVRPEAKEAIAKLKNMGIVSAVLTGDRVSTGEVIASKVGIESTHVHAQLLPKDKLDLVQSYKEKYGSTAHIGDGINDAPALACSDIGIAMGVGGSALAVEAADIALFSNNLENLPEAIRISRIVKSKLVQNVTFAICTKVIVIGLAFTGRVTLWVAVLADVGSSLLVVLNGLLILGLPKKGFHSEVNGCHAANIENKSCWLSESTLREIVVKKPCCQSSHGCGQQETIPNQHSHSRNCGRVAQEAIVKKSCCSSKNGCSEQEPVTTKSCCSKKNECPLAGTISKMPCCSSKDRQATQEGPARKQCCSGKHPKQAHACGMTAAEPKKCCTHGGQEQAPGSSSAGPSSSLKSMNFMMSYKSGQVVDTPAGPDTMQNHISTFLASTIPTNNTYQDQDSQGA